MNYRSAASTVVTILLVAAIIAFVLTQVFGFPTPVSYVETDSMAPTINPGDGFIGVPAPVAGEPEAGDIVTFRAQTIGGGGLTTHRIQEVTDEGYITRGDNNPFTDQDSGEPIVTDAQIEMVVLQFGDRPVVIPGLGIVAQLIQGLLGAVGGLLGLGDSGGANSGLLLGLGGLVLVILTVGYDKVTSDNTRLPTRNTSRREGVVDSKLILLAILIALSLPVLSMMSIPSGTDQALIVSTASPSDDPTRIVAGESSDIEIEIENNQFVPKLVVLTPQSEGVAFSDRAIGVSHGQTVETTLTLTAPEETGPHTLARSEHHYIHVLPTAVIVALHNIHPAVAMLAITGVVLSPIAILFYLIVGFRPIAIREAARNI